MKNKGLHQHRLSNDPLERAFAEEWEEQNTTFPGRKHGILDYLLSPDSFNEVIESSERDREVAATVIQWLGSPVGNSFLCKVLGNARDSKTAHKLHGEFLKRGW